MDVTIFLGGCVVVGFLLGHLLCNHIDRRFP